MHFAEDFLHYVWKFRLFDQQDLCTVSGKPIEIISAGMHNHHAGPDFENAKIRIGDTVWAGNVEIHLRSADWSKHHHHSNPAYDNVILHVVYECDVPVFRTDGSELPTLVLGGRVPQRLTENYTGLMASQNWIPCEKQIGRVDEFHIKNWLSRTLIERLEERSVQLNALLFDYRGSWDDAFYVSLAKNFGFKTNAQPMEMLARSLPQELLSRHKTNPQQVEALLFGQAGLLEADAADDYHAALKDEYGFLRKKYSLQPIDAHIWKFMRMRPQNFPTLRLAQFAGLVLKSTHLFSKILEIKEATQLKQMFINLPINNYWTTHYRFGKNVNNYSPQPGDDSVNNILINTVALFLFGYGRQLNKPGYVNRALHLLETIPAETNQIIRRFKENGVAVHRADASQALLQLKNKYCDAKKCLHCGIGIKLLNQP